MKAWDWVTDTPVRVALLAIAAAIAICVVGAKMEADAFNRATGSNVSTWDALWADFKVVGEAKR